MNFTQQSFANVPIKNYIYIMCLAVYTYSTHCAQFYFDVVFLTRVYNMYISTTFNRNHFLSVITSLLLKLAMDYVT